MFFISSKYNNFRFLFYKMFLWNSKRQLVKIWQSCFEGIHILEITRTICQYEISTCEFIWIFEQVFCVTVFFRWQRFKNSAILSSSCFKLKSPSRITLSYVVLSLANVLFFRWFAMLLLCGFQEQQGNHFFFLKFISTKNPLKSASQSVLIFYKGHRL